MKLRTLVERRSFGVGLGTLLILGGVAWRVPLIADAKNNPVRKQPPYQVPARARQLNARSVLIDLHADTLLWDRDLLKRNHNGHVDLPRLQDAGVAIQAFTVVTRVPRGQNINRTGSGTDLIHYLAIANRWPPRTWSSPLERALYQSEKLHKAASASRGELVIIRTRGDLDRLFELRRDNPRVVGAFLGLEGAHALEGDLNNIYRLFDAGFRMMAPTHFFDNDFAGAASGIKKAGLTGKGREFIRRAQAHRIIIDLAHASLETIDDVTAMSIAPVVVSHTGVRGTCDNNRNLPNKQLREIAATGGIIGIGYWQTATCGTDAKSIARAIHYAVGVVGVDHVALGSDFDGQIEAPFDVTGISLITEELLKSGLSEADVQKILGGNTLRVLSQSLPPAQLHL